MISEEQKQYIIHSNRWPFSIIDIFIRYIIFVPIFSITTLILTFVIKKFSKLIYIDFLIIAFLLVFMILCSYYSFKKIKSESKFEEVISRKTVNQIIESITNNWGELKWRLKENNETIIVFSDFDYGYRQENLITIIKNSDCTFLINSRSNGNQPFTFGRNKNNLENLKTILKN